MRLSLTGWQRIAAAIGIVVPAVALLKVALRSHNHALWSMAQPPEPSPPTPPPLPVPLRQRRVVVSLSTHASRFRNINPTLRALSSQTYTPDTIYVHPSVFMEGMIDTSGCPRCVVTTGEDFGPATKLIRTLRIEAERGSPPDTAVIVVDDDWAYPNDVVATLVREADAHPMTVVALSGYPLVSNFVGHKVSRRADVGGCPTPPTQRGPFGFQAAGGPFHRTGSTEEEHLLMKSELIMLYNDAACGQEVDVVQGAFGVLLELSWLEFCWLEAVARTMPAQAPFLHGADDIFISGALAKAGLRKRIFGRQGRYMDEQHLPHGHASTSLRYSMDHRYRKAVPFMQKQLGIWQSYTFEGSTDLSALPTVQWPPWPSGGSKTWVLDREASKTVARCSNGTQR